MNHRFLTGTATIALVIALGAAAPARADDQAPAAPAPAADQTPAPPPHPMVGSVMFSGWVEGGSNINPDDPANHVNFGQLFTDRSNSFRMNQFVLTAEKDLDPAATGMDWGFKFQPMYGTDARFTHTVGLWDRETHSPYQIDIVELNGSAHVPIVVSGGIDLKAGIYSTPIGYEVIDATGNFFYTHSYIFNFGIPLKHTGLITTSHVNDMFDVWLGVDTGVNTGLPTRGGDDNNSEALLGGLGINNPIPNLTILALAHVGAENGYRKGFSNTFCDVPLTGVVGNLTTSSCPTAFGAGARAVDPNGKSRQIYDIVTTYKINDALSVANELNYIRDDLAHADGGGAALYGTYQFNDSLSFGARGEVFRDDNGFFVAAFPQSQSFINAERGLAPGVAANHVGEVTGYNAGKANYLEVTLGANYKPPLPTLPLGASLLVRPEVRWDHAWALNPGAHPFDVNSTGAGTKDDQFLFSVDAIFGF